MQGLDQEISDYTVAIFLRYFRHGGLIGTRVPSLDLARDLEFLRAHWAISAPVRKFLQYILDHRHEVQALLQFQKRNDDAVVRGRINASASVIARQVTGHPSLIISEEPVRSFDTGPNQLVAWVVRMVADHAGRFLALQPRDSAYAKLIEAAMEEISAVKRLDALREPLKRVIMGRRPRPNALRDAARSRRQIYRHAVAAYEALTGIEAGNEVTLERVLRSTLLGPLEEWRRFELAVAVGIGEALSAEIGAPLRLSTIGIGLTRPILRCDRFSVYWQSGGNFYDAPEPEPSELQLEALLAAYGREAGEPRPDLVVVDEENKKAMAIVEVKYSAGDNADIQFREAARQIVHYARGYSKKVGLEQMIRQSLIVLNRESPALLDCTATAPLAMDFADMQAGRFRLWVKERLLNSLN